MRSQDPVVEKNRFSAFIQGSSDLGAILRARGIDTILVTGTVTNVCCESTARDAMMLNFKTIMVTDGNAAMTDEDHNASLIAFYLSFGDITSTGMLIDCLKHNAGKRAAAAEPQPAPLRSMRATIRDRDHGRQRLVVGFDLLLSRDALADAEFAHPCLTSHSGRATMDAGCHRC